MSRPLSTNVTRGVVIALGLIGVASALLRYVVPHDLHVAITRPLLGAYATEQLAVLMREPVSEASHRIGGMLYLVLGLWQLAPGVRGRWPTFRRWGGRVFVSLALIASVSGAAIAALHPFVPGERAPSFLFATLLIAFTVLGVRRARAGDIERHREWMIRGFAVGLGIATIRVIGVALTLGTNLPTRSFVAPTFWAGWCSTLLAAEVWIRIQRGSLAYSPPSEPLGPGLRVRGPTNVGRLDEGS